MRILTVLLALLAGATVAKAENLQTAIFAGGCFWCVESDFDRVEGVVDTTSGYTGGTMQNATYRNHGQHREAVKITFDADVVSYDQLLYIYWRTTDPTDGGGQFCDRGHSYTPAIYALNDAQAAAARASKAEVQRQLGVPIATVIRPAGDFWDAENYHQNYHLKNANRYDYYRSGCGRDARVAALWGDEAPFANGH